MMSLVASLWMHGMWWRSLLGLRRALGLESLSLAYGMARVMGELVWGVAGELGGMISSDEGIALSFGEPGEWCLEILGSLSFSAESWSALSLLPLFLVSWGLELAK